MEEIVNYPLSIDNYIKKHGFREFCPKAVLFDMDGVLFNSMPNHATSWHQAMASFGIDMPHADAYKYEGMRGTETIRLMARQQLGVKLTEEMAQEMYQAKTRLFAACPEAGKIEGVEDLMHRIKDNGLMIGIVTGSGQNTLLDRLEKAFPGLIDRQKIVTAFDVSRGKPDPEPYLMGLKKCGVQPWEAIVVENAPLGVRAAVAAQIFTIAVNTGPLPDQMLADEGADLVFNSMSELMQLPFFKQ